MASQDSILSWDTRYVPVAIYATIFYDYVLNLRREIDLTWRRGSTTGTILFLANRYLALAYCLFRLTVEYIRDDFLICRVMEAVGAMFSLLFFIVWAVFSALRVYAVSSKNWTLTSLALGWGLVPLVTNIVNYIKTSPSMMSIAGDEICWTQSELSVSQDLYFVLVTRLCTIASDILVVVAIWYYTRRGQALEQNDEDHTPLLSTLWRNGMLYCVCLLVMNIVNILTWPFGINSIATDVIAPITSLMVSHCLLDLREAALCSAESCALSSLSFALPRTLQSAQALPLVQESWISAMSSSNVTSETAVLQRVSYDITAPPDDAVM